MYKIISEMDGKAPKNIANRDHEKGRKYKYITQYITALTAKKRRYLTSTKKLKIRLQKFFGVDQNGRQQKQPKC